MADAPVVEAPLDDVSPLGQRKRAAEGGYTETRKLQATSAPEDLLANLPRVAWRRLCRGGGSVWACRRGVFVGLRRLSTRREEEGGGGGDRLLSTEALSLLSPSLLSLLSPLSSLSLSSLSFAPLMPPLLSSSSSLSSLSLCEN
jgi:hypothetical protein